MTTKKQHEKEKTKKKFARNQNIFCSLGTGWNARQYNANKVSAIPVRVKEGKGKSGERKPRSGRPRNTRIQKFLNTELSYETT